MNWFIFYLFDHLIGANNKQLFVYN